MAGWQLDKGHSEIGFSVRHLMISTVKGRFTDFDVNLDGDPQDLANASISVTINTESIDTNEKDRDAHLRGEDFFDIEKYPQITFQSKAVKPAGNNKFDVEGDLTIRDVTKPVTLEVTYEGGAKDPWGGDRAAFSGQLAVSRKEFGLTWNVALETGGVMVSDEVKISIEAQFVKPAQ